MKYLELYNNLVLVTIITVNIFLLRLVLVPVLRSLRILFSTYMVSVPRPEPCGWRPKLQTYLSSSDT